MANDFPQQFHVNIEKKIVSDTPHICKGMWRKYAGSVQGK